MTAVAHDTRVESTIRCLECGVQAEGTADGWRAYVGGGIDGEPPTVGVYCPVCAAREFGEAALPHIVC